MDAQQPLVGEPDPDPPRDRARMPVVVLVVAVGLTAGLLGYVFGAAPVRVNDSAPTDPFAPFVAAPSTQGPVDTTQGPEGTSSTSQPVQPPLRDLVPGLTGTLLVELGSVGLVEWPSDGASPVTTPLPAGVPLQADVSRHLFARLGPSPDDESQTVAYVGSSELMRPTEMSVYSFAWHNTIPGRLAWLDASTTGASGDLWTGLVDPDGRFTRQVLITSVPGEADGQPRSWLRGWGEWGFLLSARNEAAEEVVTSLLDPTGVEEWRVTGEALAISPRDDILIGQASADPGEWEFMIASPDAPPAEVGVLSWAPHNTGYPRVAWSPDSQNLAFIVWDRGGATSGRIEVFTRDGEPATTGPFSYRVWDIEWSHDGRFVLLPGTDDEGKHVILFHDTVDGSLDEVEFDTWIQQAFMRQGSSSPPSECQPTVPNGFVAPEPYLPSPAQEGRAWHGSPELWTVLNVEGSYQPRMSVWWSTNFPAGTEEERPAISVTWRRLDEHNAPVVTSEQGTNAYTRDDGDFMIAGIDPPEPGCWEVTAEYKGSTLTYIYARP